MINRLNRLVILIFVITLYGCGSRAPFDTPPDSHTQEVETGKVVTPTTTMEVSVNIPPTANQDEVGLNPSETPQGEMIQPTSTQQAGGDEPVMDSAIVADVISVEASGNEGAYRFSVGISSPDTGCNQYADWWEVISHEGELIYRRVLLHSHIEEQPFVRSGGPVNISPDSEVIVRAHMNTGGYGGAAFQGSVETGFSETALDPSFAATLANEPPLPDDCAF